MKITKTALSGVLALAASVVAADASSVSRLVLKVSDAPAVSGTDVVDPYLDWINTGSVNEGVAGATSLTNNGVDYKDGWVDTNWGDVTSVRVSMFTASTEVAFMEFDASGTTKADFFAPSNLTSSSWTDTGSPNLFFSIAGDSVINRHWFVQRNYSGCSADRGWFAVLDGAASPSYPCSWENNQTDPGSPTRGFLYSSASGNTNWTSGSVGVAEVFAVSVSYAAAPVPIPASGALLICGIAGLAMRARRRSVG